MTFVFEFFLKEFETEGLPLDDAQIDDLVEKFRASLKRRVGGGAKIRTITEIESVALDVRDELSHLVSDALGESSAEVADIQESENKPSVECSCGRTARFKGMRRRDIMTMVGSMSVSRRYYYCRRCDAGFCPADVKLGISRSCFTPPTKEAVAQVCALLPYDSAVSLLGRLSSVSVSASHAQSIMAEAGQAVTSYYEEALLISEQQEFEADCSPEVLYLLCDGVQTPIKGGWRETKVGLAFEGKGRRKRYVSHLGNSDDFGDLWYSVAVESGLRKAKRVVVLGDGAAWIWTQASINFLDAIQILDFWHAVERIGEIAHCAFNERIGAVKAWVEECKTMLVESKLDAVLNKMAQLGRDYPTCAELVTAATTYYNNNRVRMDYARYLEMGLNIGSGAVESACKQIVTQRLKGPGMRWTLDAAQAMARVRCVLFSNQWSRLQLHWNSLRLAQAM